MPNNKDHRGRPSDDGPPDSTYRWDPKMRKKTGDPEEAIKVLMHTGRMPRPLKLSDVKPGSVPMKRTIVANQNERRRIAEMAGLYLVMDLRAKMLLRRETHPVHGYERVVVYTKMFVRYLQPDADTCQPMSKAFDLKFKTAFREDSDPYFPTEQTQLDDALRSRGVKPASDLADGNALENVIRSVGAMGDHGDVQDNMFAEAILDNVIDLGELLVQHTFCNINLYAITGRQKDVQKLCNRQAKRMKKEFGVDFGYDKVQYDPVDYFDPRPQELHDYDVKPYQTIGRPLPVRVRKI